MAHRHIEESGFVFRRVPPVGPRRLLEPQDHRCGHPALPPAPNSRSRASANADNSSVRNQLTTPPRTSRPHPNTRPKTTIGQHRPTRGDVSTPPKIEDLGPGGCPGCPVYARAGAPGFSWPCDRPFVRRSKQPREVDHPEVDQLSTTTRHKQPVSLVDTGNGTFRVCRELTAPQAHSCVSSTAWMHEPCFTARQRHQHATIRCMSRAEPDEREVTTEVSGGIADGCRSIFR